MGKRHRVHEKQPTVLPWRTVMIVACGFAAAWVSAGSTGLMAHPLRRVLTCILMGTLVATPPLSQNRRRDVKWRAVGIVLALWMTASGFLPVNILAVAVLLTCIAIGLTGAHTTRQAVLLTSCAVAVFGIYRLACVSIPAVWLVADRIGHVMGWIAGGVTGKLMWLGATFSGIDYLVLMFAFFGGWLMTHGRPINPRPVLLTTAAIIGTHLVYLLILSLGTAFISKAGKTPWAVGFTSLIANFSLWQFPIIAGCLHLTLTVLLLRRLVWPVEEAVKKTGKTVRRQALAMVAAGMALAVVFAMTTALYPPLASLKDRKIVFYEHGFLNWLYPEHDDYGRLSIGMYGMMTTHIESLGGQCVISPDLSASDLEDADALVLLYPNEPWPEGVPDRIWKFVENGGSLLVMGEHTVREPEGGSRFNEILERTAMQVAFDSATFAIGGWLNSYQSVSHPAFIGIEDERNLFGAVIGASVQARWPARPLLMGRWGWADPGDEAGSAMMGNGDYDPGEKLGDMVLAAEQRIGKGKVVVFGDTSSLTNGILIDSHEFVYRLYSYLMDPRQNAHPLKRQLPALLIAMLLPLLLVVRPAPEKTLCVVLCLAAALAICRNQSAQSKGLIPDGRLKEPNNLAYIDGSHLSMASEESWREDGTMGLVLTLMRNGYLTLSLPELTKERLDRAAMLVLIAPQRTFTEEERKIVYDFVDQGGILICTVGYEDAGPIRPLLSDLGFDVGSAMSVSGRPPLEPQPLGHYKAPYLNTGEYMSYVRFHAAWPVVSSDPNARVMAYGRNDATVILRRQIGRGKAVLVGDTGFAMNKNLERQDGSPFEGMRENAYFWRWFITVLRDETMWVPPDEVKLLEQARKAEQEKQAEEAEAPKEMVDPKGAVEQEEAEDG